ncbi:MAG TPA: radical SAM family heme chaperone HemW [Lacipirellulaceae bacterium]
MTAAIIATQTPIDQVRTETPRAAYIHVPFCRHRCGYCNFTLVAGRDDLIDDYLRAIELELSRVGTARQFKRNDDALVGGAHPTANEVDTLYFGGGTPTHLSPEQLRRLAKAALQRHPLAAGYEWTVEANPADVNQNLIGALSEMGVTRLSLGGQSFRPEKLRLLERDHEPGDIVKAIHLAHSAGLQVSLDLIFATPGETLSDWESDLEAALALKPDHLSSYGLTFERGTAFWMRRLRGQLDELSEELQRDMYALAIDKLTAAGFEHYEISNFARPGCRSRHNQTYWAGEGYFAYGPGAARYVDGVRETNHRSTTTYLKRMLAGKSPVTEREKLAPKARARELLVFGLRRIEGVSRREFTARTGQAVDALVGDAVRKFVELGLLDDDGEQIRLTREGLFVSDALWPEML